MKIITVNKDGLGEVIGLKPGDRLLKINNKKEKTEYRAMYVKTSCIVIFFV